MTATFRQYLKPTTGSAGGSRSRTGLAGRPPDLPADRDHEAAWPADNRICLVGRRELLLDDLAEGPEGLAPVADRVLLGRRQLGVGAPLAVGDEDRVVAEPTGAPG